MRRIIIILSLLLFLAAVSHAEGIKLGVGAFGGMSIPIVQDDQGNGSTFGFLVKYRLIPSIVVEPNFTTGKWGKPDAINGFNLGIDGSKLTSFGVDIVLGNDPGKVGFKPYLVAGVGSYKIKNDDTGYDESNIGWSGGLGVALGISPILDIDARGKLLVAPQDEGSKKAATVTGGLNYYFGAK